MKGFKVKLDNGDQISIELTGLGILTMTASSAESSPMDAAQLSRADVAALIDLLEHAKADMGPEIETMGGTRWR